MRDNVFVSMVVDDVDNHAYKVDLLIITLRRYAGIAPR